MKKRGDGYRRYIIIIGVVVLFIIALSGAVEYTSRSEFCKKCHEMWPVYETWQSSSHYFVDCIKCHSDPGIIGLVKTKAQALKEVYRHFTNTYDKPISIDSDTAAFSKRCLRCHQDIKGKGPAHNEGHFEANLTCADCHKGLVHNDITNNKLPSRAVCTRCHGGE